MKRAAAHYIYCSPQRILQKSIVEIDDDGKILRFLALADYPEEIHSTVFYNGVLIPALFEDEDLTAFQHKPVVESLNNLFKKKKTGLKEGYFSVVYLIENVDLQKMRFTADCTLRRI